MPKWKYRAQCKADGSFYDGSIDMYNYDDDQIKCLQRIDELREKLQERGYQFIDARPLSDIEKKSANYAEKIIRMKRKPKSIRRRRPYVFGLLSLLCLVALCLLALLLV
jgi:hypothetical protein